MPDMAGIEANRRNASVLFASAPAAIALMDTTNILSRGRRIDLLAVETVYRIVNQMTELAESIHLEAQADRADFNLGNTAIVAVNDPAAIFAGEYGFAALCI